MRKILIPLLILIPVLLATALIATPKINDLTAAKISTALESLPLPEDTEYIDSVSKAAKLVGNGNGMQYLGAILIKSDLTEEELNAFYTPYRKGEFDCLVRKQPTPQIDFVEHDTVTFKTTFKRDENYYIVYTWGNGIEPFASIDIRGR